MAMAAAEIAAITHVNLQAAKGSLDQRLTRHLNIFCEAIHLSSPLALHQLISLPILICIDILFQGQEGQR